MIAVKKIKTESILKYFNIIQTAGVFLLIFLFLSIAYPSFCTSKNLTNLLNQLSTTLIIAAGMTIILISGEIDISVGSIVGLAGIIGGIILKKYGIFAGYSAALIVGLLVGLFNGVVTIKGRIPSFITTLGTMRMARSLCYVFSGGLIIGDFPDKFSMIGQQDIFGIPWLLICVAIVFIIMYISMRKTSFGQYVYAVGSNKEASILSGINSDLVKIKSFAISGLLAGFAGILTASRVMAIGPDSGTGLEFEVIAGVVIGGTSMAGGIGNVLQSIIGVLIIGMIRNGINLSDLNIFWNDFVTGGVIIIAVLLDTFRQYASSRIEEKNYLKKANNNGENNE